MNFKEFIKQQQERNVFLVLWSFYWRFIVVVAVAWTIFFIGFCFLMAILAGLASL